MSTSSALRITPPRARGRGKRGFLVWGVIIAICAAALVGTYLLFVKAPPPNRIIIATGGKGKGGYYGFAQDYKKELEKQGITLEVLETKGSGENLKLLEENAKEIAEDPDISAATKENLKALGDGAAVSVAIIQSGVAKEDDSKQLEALGSLYREPLWVFYRSAEPIERLSQLAGKRISVGPEGSGTYPIAVELLSANGLTEAADAAGDKKTTLVKPEKIADSATALQKGDLDAAFFVTGVKTAYIQDLLNDKNIRLLPFGQHEAYHRKYRFLSQLTLPEGLVNLGQDVPAKDVPLVAPTAMLVARKELHPALVSLLLTVATDVHKKGDELSNPGEFPSASFTDVPVSKDAEEFYKAGPPVLQRFLPFWLASLVDRLKIMLVPLVMLMLPLFRAAPPLVRWRTRRKIYLWYSALRDIDQKIALGLSAPALEQELARLREINRQVTFVEVPLSYMEEFYHLRLHLTMLLQTLERLQEQRAKGLVNGPGATEADVIQVK